MKIKTSELTGVALDWAVAKCEGATDFWFDTVATYWVKLNGEDHALRYGWDGMSYLPSTDWSQGGTIIERERIRIRFEAECYWLFETPTDTWLANYEGVGDWFGPTPLIAAMRCYVARKLGNEVEIPEGLIK